MSTITSQAAGILTKKAVRTVLLVEDDGALQKCIADLFKLFFGNHINVLVAGDLLQAELLYIGHSMYIDIIFMDTGMGRGITTFDLTTRIITKGFKKPIIAISADDNYRQHMMKLGCSHHCRKENIGDFLEQNFQN